MHSPNRAPKSPIKYEASFEVPEDGETETQNELLKTLKHISEVTLKDSGHATRSVHAKSHGLLRGELHVLDGLPAVLAQGIFAKAGDWPVLIRLSTVPGDMLDDSVSTPRGFALKVIGVEGTRLQGSENDVTQDFILVNCGAEFSTPNAKKFLGGLKLLASTTDKVPKLKKALSAVMRGTEKVIESLGGKSATVIGLGGHPETHILGETFFSKAPILFGPYMAKISIVPTSANLKKLTDTPLNVNGKPNGLRDAVVELFAHDTAEWDLRVQLCTDLASMPIEDASVSWPEESSPYLTVARIIAGPQVAWSAERSKAVDDKILFSPWHGIIAHRPIGSIMRIRKAAYEMSAKFRAEHNDLDIIEPKNLDHFPP
ncbi:catalase family protein [Solimicrobium silvestre]|uniref:Catalase n=1 Tax=Solimicrobium silvestre TaxID=2099400 RepID=A0A2S9GXK2_9BURK|nr:catalase family protein [Solimicrobium silvestre]PRC92443.1 Catalase [Solimicrobium silvestre]